MQRIVSLGDESQPALIEAIRRHGNLAEWAPLALLLMVVCELNGLERVYLHVAGASLLIGRLLHPLGVRHNVMPHPLRAIGAGLTVLVVLLLGLVAIVQWFAA